jgi:hypothetical protein
MRRRLEGEREVVVGTQCGRRGVIEERLSGAKCKRGDGVAW